ncbi:MAG: Wzz/FepE/Etk N-terminal domain-containing protein [Desulfatiglandaceae bacterium]
MTDMDLVPTTPDMPMRPAEYLAILKRRKWSLIFAALMVSSIGLTVAMLLPPVYKSTATILIEEQDIPPDYVMTTVTSYAEQRIQSINQRIMSSTRLLEIINRFDLYADLKDKRTTEEIIEKMRDDVTLKPLSAEIIDRRTGRQTAATIAFTLSYEGKNPRKVQKVADTLTSLFLEENLKVRTKQAQETSGFLEGEKDRVNAELAKIEAKIAAFKEQHIKQLPEMLPVNQQSLNNLERNIDRAREELRRLRERKEYLQTQLNGIEPYLKDEEETLHRKRLEELKVQLIALTKRYSEDYPDVKKTRAEIAELEQKLLDAEDFRGAEKSGPDNPAYITLSAQLAGTQSDIQSVLRELDELNADADRYRAWIAATPGVEGQYNDLIGARNNTYKKYNDLMQKHMEARVAQGLEKEQKGERFTLIDAPRLPEKPIKPNRLAIMLIGFVLGIGAGIGTAALREFSDDAIRDGDKLEMKTQFPVLTVIPEVVATGVRIRRKRKRVMLAFGSAGALTAGVLGFHFFVMDWYIFWAKLMRKLAW